MKVLDLVLVALLGYGVSAYSGWVSWAEFVLLLLMIVHLKYRYKLRWWET